MNEALAELRRTRRSHRLQDQEWFEIVYRVYLAALVGGGAILVASDRVDDSVITNSGIDELRDRGPAVLGLLVIVAVAAGLRSGSNGGPIAIEAADVRHLLLAPIPRRTVLQRPVVQRLRTLAFAGAVLAAVAGQLAARRLPGSSASWMATAAVAGACSLVPFGAVAVVTHALHVQRAVATALGLVLVGWQLLAASTASVIGPGDAYGGLALWGLRRRPAELLAVVATLAIVTAAVALCGRLRVDALTRRADLVSQLRFAVTMQDLRTVIVLRRQLRNERPRQRPWLRMPPSAGSSTLATVRRRGWHSLARMPFARISRTALLATVAGGAAVMTLRGTTPAVLGVGVVLFAMSLELLEPLSQEIDHPDRTDTVPLSRDTILAGHLLVPALALVPFALVGAGVVAVFEPEAAAAAFALSLPMAWVGACGAVVSTVRDAQDPLARNAPWTPPEFAGLGTALRILVPLAVSTIAAIPVVALREQPTADTAVRSVVALVLVAAACGWWVSRRERWRSAFRNFVDQANP